MAPSVSLMLATDLKKQWSRNGRTKQTESGSRAYTCNEVVNESFSPQAVMAKSSSGISGWTSRYVPSTPPAKHCGQQVRMNIFQYLLCKFPYLPLPKSLANENDQRHRQPLCQSLQLRRQRALAHRAVQQLLAPSSSSPNISNSFPSPSYDASMRGEGR